MKAKVCKNCGQQSDSLTGPWNGPYKLWSTECKRESGCVPGEFEEVEVDLDAVCRRCGKSGHEKQAFVDLPNYNHKTKTYYDFCLERRNGWTI